MRIFLISIATAAVIACSGDAAELSSQAQAQAKEHTALSSELPTLKGGFIWQIDKQKSALTFQADHNGPFTGHFSHFDAAINLNPDNPENGAIHAIVALASIDAGDSDRNANLPLADWFDMNAFPTAKFISTEITKTDAGYAAAGELTIKGISQPATLTFTLDIQDGTAHALGQLELDRRDFKLGESSDFANEDWVKFPVIVKVDIKARP